MSEQPDGGKAQNVPFVAIGKGESAPWADLSLHCPECRCGPLPLLDSAPPGLTYIKCPEGHGVWLRGQPRFAEIFGDQPRGKTDDSPGGVAV